MVERVQIFILLQKLQYPENLGQFLQETSGFHV